MSRLRRVLHGSKGRLTPNSWFVDLQSCTPVGVITWASATVPFHVMLRAELNLCRRARQGR